MRNTQLFLLLTLLAVAIVAVALSKNGYWLFLLWLGFDFLVIAVGYLTLGPIIFGKDATGRTPLWAKIFFLPYSIYSLAIWHGVRVLSRESAIDRITDDIFVGRRLLSFELNQRFDVIVDLTAEFEEPSGIRAHSGYLAFPMLDAAAPSPAALTACIEKLPPGVIFIHCAQGHGRTGLFALAVLLRRKIVPSVEEGLALLRAARPGISLNSVQIKCIDAFASSDFLRA
jgi:protein-tyrosine phosphatase